MKGLTTWLHNKHMYMSIRTAIGRLEPDGTVSYIFCKFNGEEDHDTLSEYYFDSRCIDKLLAHGDIISLEPRPEDCGILDLAGFDRIHTAADVEAFLAGSCRVDAEHHYLFQNDCWIQFRNEVVARKLRIPEQGDNPERS